MNLLVVGINHLSAPVELREKVAFTPEQLGDALPALASSADLQEVAILSTCNRTEVIATTEETTPGAIVSWLADYHRLPADALEHCTYSHLNRDAAAHTSRVASGLDSMVLGEPQIFGQVKDCFEQARLAGTVGKELTELAQATFRIAKRVRSDTAIGESSVSVASTAVTLASRLFSDLGRCHILLIGAGETSELVGQHVKAAGIQQITIANRTLANARRLAETLGDGAEAIDLQSIPNRLPSCDIVVASTAAQLPILGKGTVERALKARKHRPILMIDLAVPRDIEPEVASLRDIYLYSVDDLQEIVQTNLEQRQEAARGAENIVEQEVARYRTRHERKTSDAMLIAFRAHHESIREAELERAIARLAKGDAPEAVMEQLAKQLTNKMLHVPSTQLRKAGENSDQSLLDAVRQLYQLDNNRE